MTKQLLNDDILFIILVFLILFLIFFIYYVEYIKNNDTKRNNNVELQIVKGDIKCKSNKERFSTIESEIENLKGVIERVIGCENKIKDLVPSNEVNNEETLCEIANKIENKFANKIKHLLSSNKNEYLSYQEMLYSIENKFTNEIKELLSSNKKSNEEMLCIIENKIENKVKELLSINRSEYLNIQVKYEGRLCEISNKLQSLESKIRQYTRKEDSFMIKKEIENLFLNIEILNNNMNTQILNNQIIFNQLDTLSDKTEYMFYITWAFKFKYKISNYNIKIIYTNYLLLYECLMIVNLTNIIGVIINLSYLSIKSLSNRFFNKNHIKNINIPAEPGCCSVLSLIPPKNCSLTFKNSRQYNGFLYVIIFF